VNLQESLDQQAAPKIALLHEAYAIGNSPLFSTIRVFRKGDRYWELNTLRTRVWAVNWVNFRKLVHARFMMYAW
jgi:hypothetical protein